MGRITLQKNGPYKNQSPTRTKCASRSIALRRLGTRVYYEFGIHLHVLPRSPSRKV
ncbi:unnamed protein product [Rhodiola kirilowii]